MKHANFRFGVEVGAVVNARWERAKKWYRIQTEKTKEERGKGEPKTLKKIYDGELEEAKTYSNTKHIPTK